MPPFFESLVFTTETLKFSLQLFVGHIGFLFFFELLER
jgi:hypothetical protein